MDELELLKKDWKKNDDKYPQLSYNEIYRMILKKSSSIVKWIFIISLLEFVFWVLVSFLLKGAGFSESLEGMDMNGLLIPLSILSYGILFYFFYLFYTNYRRISATDTTKKLMENILKTRRTVKQYVAVNLIFLVIGTFYGIFYVIGNDPNMVEQVEKASANGEVFKVYAIYIISTIVALAIMIVILLGFYYLIYGLLLKRLNKNYRELKKMEV